MRREKTYTGSDAGVVLQCLSEFFHLDVVERPAEGQDVVLFDPSKVIAAVPLSDRARKLVGPYAPEGLKPPRTEGYDGQGLATSSYSMNYLEFILEFFSKTGSESIKITMGTDFPFQAEDNDWRFFLAPRRSD